VNGEDARLRVAVDAERAVMSADVYEVGSMLSYDERALLHWAARTARPGAIVDLGSFLGGSTLALARGAEGDGRTVHAFDRFVLNADWERHWMPDGFAVEPGQSTREAFDHNVAAVADRVAIHEGDVRDVRWEAPIGLLFVDIAKHWEVADAVWRTFLPRLSPGAVVIQQDLVHWGHPWCAIVMELLADRFEYLGWIPYSSAVYRCVAPIREDDLPAHLLTELSCEEMLGLVERAALRVGEPGAGPVRLSAVRVLGSCGRFDEARGRLAELDDGAGGHIAEGFAWLARWLDEVEAGRTTVS
jgi:predicted O-methyltransferase YrrM